MFKAVKTNRRAIIAAIPIIGVNITAFTGQFAFMRDHIHTWPLAGIVMLAATLESIAVYLAYEAHSALIKGDSSFMLRMSSYLFGAGIGALNYSHYALPGFRPTFLAVATGLMSVSSAPLWAVYSRRIGYRALLERGLIEPRSVKFSRVRWIMWPRETFSAFRLAAWTGTQDPTEAVKDWERAQEVKRVVAEAEKIAERDAMTLETAITQADAIRIAITDLGDTATTAEIVEYLANARPRAWSVTAPRVRQVRSERTRAASAQASPNLRALPGAGQSESG